MSDNLSAIERMEIERACERLTYIYGRALDLGDMSAAADCFAENGSFARPMNPGQVIQGREAVRTSLLTRPKTLLTKHLATNAMIDVESRDSARSIPISPHGGDDARRRRPRRRSSRTGRSTSVKCRTASSAKTASGSFWSAAGRSR